MKSAISWNVISTGEIEKLTNELSEKKGIETDRHRTHRVIDSMWSRMLFIQLEVVLYNCRSFQRRWSVVITKILLRKAQSVCCSLLPQFWASDVDHENMWISRQLMQRNCKIELTMSTLLTPHRICSTTHPRAYFTACSWMWKESQEYSCRDFKIRLLQTYEDGESRKIRSEMNCSIYKTSKAQCQYTIHRAFLVFKELTMLRLCNTQLDKNPLHRSSHQPCFRGQHSISVWSYLSSVVPSSCTAVEDALLSCGTSAQSVVDSAQKDDGVDPSVGDVGGTPSTTTKKHRHYS